MLYYHGKCSSGRTGGCSGCTDTNGSVCVSISLVRLTLTSVFAGTSELNVDLLIPKGRLSLLNNDYFSSCALSLSNFSFLI